MNILKKINTMTFSLFILGISLLMYLITNRQSWFNIIIISFGYNQIIINLRLLRDKEVKMTKAIKTERIQKTSKIRDTNICGILGLCLALFSPLSGLVLGIVSLARKEKIPALGIISIVLSIGVWIFSFIILIASIGF